MKVLGNHYSPSQNVLTALLELGAKPTYEFISRLILNPARSIFDIYGLVIMIEKNNLFNALEWQQLKKAYSALEEPNPAMLGILSKLSEKQKPKELRDARTTPPISSLKKYETLEAAGIAYGTYSADLYIYGFKFLVTTPELIERYGKVKKGMRDHTGDPTKERFLAEIYKLDRNSQLEVIKECLEPGTVYNQFFSTQRGLFKTSETRGTLGILKKLRSDLEQQLAGKALPPTVQPKALGDDSNDDSSFLTHS
jgi:hypothetical protein